MDHAWKVLTKKRFSIASPITVKYRVCEWVRPPALCGPLCCFETLHHAKHFMKYTLTSFSEEDVLYVTCQYLPSREVSIYYMDYSRVTKRHLSSLPRGTLLAKSIRCLE